MQIRITKGVICLEYLPDAVPDNESKYLALNCLEWILPTIPYLLSLVLTMSCD